MWLLPTEVSRMKIYLSMGAFLTISKRVILWGNQRQ